MPGPPRAAVAAAGLLAAVVAAVAGAAGRPPLVQQGPKLRPADASDVSPAGFGESAALSADGNTALVGGSDDGGSVGAAWVFVRTGGVWKQQGPKLTGAGEVGRGMFGFSVSLSADGSTALVGGQADNLVRGAAWVFTRSGDSWTQQGPKLTGRGETSDEKFLGFSVALSADGNTALIGDNGHVGAAWVFTRSGGVWKQQGRKLTGRGELGEAHFGTSVALSADGNTALVGGDGDNDGTGAAWVFTGAEGVGCRRATSSRVSRTGTRRSARTWARASRSPRTGTPRWPAVPATCAASARPGSSAA